MKITKIRQLAADAAYLIEICGEIRGIALKHVGCTNSNVKKVNDLVDEELEKIRKEINQ